MMRGRSVTRVIARSCGLAWAAAFTVSAARPRDMVHVARARRDGASRRGRHGAERGSVTAETAVALPAIVFVMAVAVWGVTAAAAQVACVDAARAGARAAARGEPAAAVRAAVSRAAPRGAAVDVRRGPQVTRVVVRVVVRPPGADLFPPLALHAQAVAATEPG